MIISGVVNARLYWMKHSNITNWLEQINWITFKKVTTIDCYIQMLYLSFSIFKRGRMAYFFREIFYETVGTLQRCTFFAVDGPRCMQIFLAHAMTCILAIFMAIFCMHEIRPKKPFSGHIAGFFIGPLDYLVSSFFGYLGKILSY